MGEDGFDFFEGGGEVGGGGRFFASGGAGAAEEEVVGLEPGVEEVEFARGEAGVGGSQLSGGGCREAAGEVEEGLAFGVEHFVVEPGDVADDEVAAGLEVEVAAEHAVGGEEAGDLEDAFGELGAGVFLGEGDAARIGVLDEEAGVDVGELGQEAVEEEGVGGQAAPEGAVGGFLVDFAECEVAVDVGALFVVHRMLGWWFGGLAAGLDVAGCFRGF